MPGPLDGLRVLDFTTMVSGPLATMILADQGADVIKIESQAGDLMRNYGVIHQGMSSSFLSCNRSKRSLSIDLKAPDGLAAVRALIPSADVLVQNFRPGAIDRMGLGERAVRELRRDIVFVSISGVGEDGPYAAQRVYDPVIQALSGLADVQADRESGVPRMIRTIVPDKTAALTTAQAITAALLHRARTGEGQHVKLAMLDAMVAFLWPEAISSLTFVGNEADPARGQMGLDLVFKTKDRYITAGALSDREWAGMCRALGREDLIADARFATVALRSRNYPERRQIMADEIGTWDSAAILARFAHEEVPSAPILARTDLIGDPQIAANHTLEIIADGHLGPVRQPRPPARFDRSPSAITAVAPYLGEHGREVLAGAGLEASAIDDLLARGVVKIVAPRSASAAA